MEVIRELRQPKVAVMLALGFGSGLPFMLIGNTLGFWLADEGVGLATIGFLSWASMPYLVKFLWGATVDRVPAPLLGRLGRRRGWILFGQICVAIGIVGMATAGFGKLNISRLAGFAVFTGFAAAVQDTVVDAWRIESAADTDELGLLTAAYSLGYRAAMIATEALILSVAQRIGWPLSYAIFGAVMVVAMIALVFAREPARADAVMEAKSLEAKAHPARAIYDAVVGPFIVFFREHGWKMALLMLGMITLYHLSDYLRGPMSNPYYKTLGLSKDTVAAVRTTIGLAGSLFGIAAGGLASVRFGYRPTLIVGAIIQPICIAAFAVLGWHGGDFSLVGPIRAYETIMAADAFAIGFSGVALVAYMSSLTSLGYTATQYALLTSALAWAGKTLKGFSGVWVEGLHHGRTLLDAYAQFYLYCGLIGVPAVAFCIILAMAKPKLAASYADETP